MNLTKRTTSSDRIKLAVLLLIALAVFFRAELAHLLPHSSADEVKYLISKAADAVNRGDYKRAIAVSDTVLKQYPDSPIVQRAHMVKGLALLKSGERADAVAEFKTVTTKYPNTKEAQPARNALANLALADKNKPEPPQPQLPQPGPPHDEKPATITPQPQGEPSPLITVKGSVAGIWSGVNQIGNFGMCSLALEIHDKGGQLTGKSLMNCTVNPLSYKPAYAVTTMSFKGSSTNGNALLDHFELIDRTRDTSPCLVNAMTLTRIGPMAMVAQYHDEYCGGSGGQMTLGFAGKPPEAAPEAPKPAEIATSQSPIAALLGMWQGTATVEDRGFCTILLDLHSNLTADLRMECRQAQGQSVPDIFVSSMTGIGWSGLAAMLREDRILQRPRFAKQCLANKFTVSTIAGTNKILAEWSDNAPCKEFKAILEPRHE